MTTSIPSPANIIDSIPEPVPKISSLPTYSSLCSVHKALKANAFSFATTLSGGSHGYFGLILPHAHYNAIVPPLAGQQHSWKEPAYPGTHPNIPHNATAAKTGALICHHTKAKQLWQEWRNVHNVIKMQFLQAIDPVYLCSSSNLTAASATYHQQHTRLHLQSLQLHHNPSTRQQQQNFIK